MLNATSRIIPDQNWNHLYFNRCKEYTHPHTTQWKENNKLYRSSSMMKRSMKALLPVHYYRGIEAWHAQAHIAQAWYARHNLVVNTAHFQSWSGMMLISRPQQMVQLQKVPGIIHLLICDRKLSIGCTSTEVWSVDCPKCSLINHVFYILNAVLKVL